MNPDDNEYHWQAKFHALVRAINAKGYTVRDEKVQKFSGSYWRFVLDYNGKDRET